MHPEDRLSAGTIGRLHRNPAVEPTRAQQRLVEHVGAVRRADDDHVRGRVEAVHLGQNLIQGLLALVVAAAEARDSRSTRAPDRIQLVDEDDRGRSRTNPERSGRFLLVASARTGGTRRESSARTRAAGSATTGLPSPAAGRSRPRPSAGAAPTERRCLRTPGSRYETASSACFPRTAPSAYKCL